MITNDILQLLNDEIADFPNRASGEQLYEQINKIAAAYVIEKRQELVFALMEWLLLRSEPKTMLAVDIAGNLHLTELRSALEELLLDVEEGKAFKSYYSKPIKRTLTAM